MGHQLNYFLTPIDLKELEERIRQKDPVLYLVDRTKEPKPKILAVEEMEKSGLYLHLARPDDLKKIKMEFFSTQKYWTFENFHSPLVEYGRCFFDGKVLRRGRLYYIDGAYNKNGAWVEKSEDFKKWAKSLLVAAKKTLKHEDGFYFGSEALAWMKKKGAKLTNGGSEISLK